MLQSTTVSVDDAVCDVLRQSNYRNYLTELVRMKFDCETILNVPLNTQSRQTRPQILYEKTLGKKARIKLSVQRDDLTNHPVDAVVNAANEYLQHYGGLALALQTAGGVDIQNESNAIIDKKGKIATGDAVLTTGGRLICKYVIHAVGPECRLYSHDHTTCRKLLQKAIGNILKICTEKSDIQSVAIPALSSGIFNFPLEDCAEDIVKTIIDFCEKVTSSEGLKEIRLVNHDDKTVKAMQKACEKIIGRDGSFPGNATMSFSRQSPDTITVNNVILQIERGHIENQKTDVIVNSVSDQLNLSEGNISQAILRKAGPELQKEIVKKAQEVKYSPVIKTKGCNLRNFVYHAIVPNAQTSGSDKVLQKAVQICLEKTIKDGSRSISFPAIGTGNLNFSKRKVASIMTSEVIRFATFNPEKYIHVHFVIYPKDNETFQAFQDELKLLKSEKNPLKVDQRSAEAGHHLPYSVNDNIEPVPIKPTITLRGSHHTDVEEAEKWISNTMHQHQKCLLVENNLIIYLGTDEHNTLFTNIDPSVSCVENVKDRSAHMKIEGLGPDVIKAALEIESLLCKVQKQYELKQEEELVQLAELLSDEYDNRRQQYKRIPDVCELKHPIDKFNPQWKKEETEFQKAGLRIVKVESIHNKILSVIYQSKKKEAVARQKNDPCIELYHRVPAQFCNLICRLGFNRIYSRQAEQKYGAGMYFSKSLQSLQQNSKQKLISDKYIYIFKAEVVTGKFTKGKESYIVPPPIGADCMDLYDSVVDDIHNPETFVIFNSQQAIPQILFTCEKIM